MRGHSDRGDPGDSSRRRQDSSNARFPPARQHDEEQLRLLAQLQRNETQAAALYGGLLQQNRQTSQPPESSIGARGAGSDALVELLLAQGQHGSALSGSLSEGLLKPPQLSHQYEYGSSATVPSLSSFHAQLIGQQAPFATGNTDLVDQLRRLGDVDSVLGTEHSRLLGLAGNFASVPSVASLPRSLPPDNTASRYLGAAGHLSQAKQAEEETLLLWMAQQQSGQQAFLNRQSTVRNPVDFSSHDLSRLLDSKLPAVGAPSSQEAAYPSHAGGVQGGDPMSDYAYQVALLSQPPGVAAAAAASRPPISNKETFPQRLYKMIMDAEELGRSDIISFTPSGKAFKVHDRNAFLEEIAPRHSRIAKFSSFKRQLYLYDFQFVRGGPDDGAYSHPLFVKGKPEQLRRIERVSQGCVERSTGRKPY